MAITFSSITIRFGADYCNGGRLKVQRKQGSCAKNAKKAKGRRKRGCQTDGYAGVGAPGGAKEGEEGGALRFSPSGDALHTHTYMELFLSLSESQLTQQTRSA